VPPDPGPTWSVGVVVSCRRSAYWHSN
jgi:hypothetical protein